MAEAAHMMDLLENQRKIDQYIVTETSRSTEVEHRFVEQLGEIGQKLEEQHQAAECRYADLKSSLGVVQSQMDRIMEKLDALVSDSHSFAVENEIAHSESQVFDQLPVKQFIDLSGEKVDSNNQPPAEVFSTNFRLQTESIYHSLGIRSPTPKIAFPRFDGTNTRSWILRCHGYFQFVPHLSDAQKIALASLHLEGKALTWFTYFFQEGISVSWARFLDLIRTRFEDIQESRIVVDFDKLKLKGSSEDYTDKSEELQSPLLLIEMNDKLEENFVGCVKEITSGHGGDVACDSVGNGTFVKLLECLNICEYIKRAAEVSILEKQRDESDTQLTKDADILRTWINIWEDTWSLQCSYVKAKEKDTNADHDRHKNYFTNWVIELLSSYEKGLRTPIDLIGKYVVNLKILMKETVAEEAKSSYYFAYMSAVNSIRVLFDPGGYIISTWKTPIPLNFGSVTVGIGNLYLKFFVVLNVGDAHKDGLSDKRNRKSALIMFYSLASHEALLFLLGKVYLAWKVNVKNYLKYVKNECDFSCSGLIASRRFFYDAYLKCVNGSLFDGLTIDIVSFTMELLDSNLPHEQLFGARILQKIPTNTWFSEDSLQKMGISLLIMEKLIKMLNWKDLEEGEIRYSSTGILSKLAIRRQNLLQIAGIPRTLESSSSLLHVSRSYDGACEEIFFAAITLDGAGANYNTVWVFSKCFPIVKKFVCLNDFDHGPNLDKAGAIAVIPKTLEPSLPTSKIEATTNDHISPSFFGKLNPRGRGLVEPGGNVMTPSHYAMKLGFSFDNDFVSIWSSQLCYLHFSQMKGGLYISFVFVGNPKQ